MNQVCLICRFDKYSNTQFFCKIVTRYKHDYSQLNHVRKLDTMNMIIFLAVKFNLFTNQLIIHSVLDYLYTYDAAVWFRKNIGCYSQPWQKYNTHATINQELLQKNTEIFIRFLLIVLERTKNTSSKDENDYNLNTLTKIVMGVLALSLLVIIALAIVVRCLWKKQRRSVKFHQQDITIQSLYFIGIPGPHFLFLRVHTMSSLLPLCAMFTTLHFTYVSDEVSPFHPCVLSKVQPFHHLISPFPIVFDISILFLPFTSLHLPSPLLNIFHPLYFDLLIP